MEPPIINIEQETLKNIFYRRVIYTGKYIQIVLMNIPSGKDISLEIHSEDQFVQDFARAWTKVMNLDRFDLE